LFWIESDEALFATFTDATRFPYIKNATRALIPLSAEGKTVGGMSLHFAGQRRLGQGERSFILAVAGQAAQALERARLYEEAEKARRDAEEAARRIATLQKITVALAGAFTAQDVVEIVVHQGVQMMEAIGGAIYLTFDLDKKHAGQAFTLVQKKADGTYEYFYATADTDGNVTFGTIYELSPFMLVKERLFNTSAGEAVNVPQTGDVSNWQPFVLIAIAVLYGMGATVFKTKSTQA
jgi:hypothetical protein